MLQTCCAAQPSQTPRNRAFVLWIVSAISANTKVEMIENVTCGMCGSHSLTHYARHL